MSIIEGIIGREIIDSRGNPTVEVEVELHAEDRAGEGSHLATSGRFTLVAVDAEGKPRSL